MSPFVKYSSLILGALVAGSILGALPANATVLNFDTVPTAATNTPGFWSPDRQAPAGFASAFFDGDNRLALTLSSADYQSNVFYDTQGRLYDLSAGTQYLSVQLYVTQSMIDSPNRVTGLWGQAADANNTPIVELGDGHFRGWDPVNGGWTNLGAPGSANQWYTLAIYHDTGAGLFDYYVNGVLLGSAGDSGAADLVHAILQGENGVLPGWPPTTAAGSGVDGTYFYDNLTYAAVSPTPLPGALPLFVTGGGLLGFFVLRRKKCNRSAAAVA